MANKPKFPMFEKPAKGKESKGVHKMPDGKMMKDSAMDKKQAKFPAFMKKK
jgi:hypothetical protein